MNIRSIDSEGERKKEGVSGAARVVFEGILCILTKTWVHAVQDRRYNRTVVVSPSIYSYSTLLTWSCLGKHSYVDLYRARASGPVNF